MLNALRKFRACRASGLWGFVLIGFVGFNVWAAKRTVRSETPGKGTGEAKTFLDSFKHASSVVCQVDRSRQIDAYGCMDGWMDR